MAEWIISSSVLIGAVWAGRALLKGKISLRLQYALWALVLVRLLVPFSLFDSAMSVQNVVEQQEIPQVYENTHVQIPVRDYETAYEQVVRRYEAQGVEITPSQEPVIQEEVRKEMNLDLSLGEIVKGVWLVGMTVMGIWLLASNGHFYLRLRRSRKLLEAIWVPVKVYVTGAVRTPCLYGVFRPAIYVTPDVAADEKTLKYVLNHEVTHFRHFDHIWAALRSVCLVLHWYNPLVWVAAKLSRQDAEMACDEGTLLLIGEENRGDYGRTLVDLTCHAGHPSLLISATTMTGGKREMKERIVLLMKHPKTALITAIAVVLCGAILIGCTFTGAKENTEPKETEPAATTEPAETTEPVETTTPVPTTEPVVEKTEEEIKAEIAELFISRTVLENWYNNALFSTYEGTYDVNIYEMFRDGYSNSKITEEEMEFLEQKLGKSVAPERIRRITGAEMDEVLMQVFGQKRSSFNLSYEGFYYYAKSEPVYLWIDNSRRTSDCNIQEIIVHGDTAEVLHTKYDDWYRVTLARYEDRWVITSNLLVPPPLYTLPDGAVELTAEQIEQVNAAFPDFVQSDSGGWVHGTSQAFLSCFYGNPSDIRLSIFLRYFSVEAVAPERMVFLADEEQFEILRKKDGFPNSHITDFNKYPLPIHRYLREDVDAVMRRFTGISVSEINDRGVLYLSDFDSYYTFTSDAESFGINCVGGYLTENGVVLFSQNQSVLYINEEGYLDIMICNTVLTLREEDGKYYIVSHLPLEAE